MSYKFGVAPKLLDKTISNLFKQCVTALFNEQ